MEMSSDAKKPLPVILRIFRVLIVLAAAVFVAAVLIKTRKVPEKQELVKSPPRVEVMAARTQSRVMRVEAFGTVKPRKMVQIAAEVPGKIVYLHPSFIEGGRIGRGDLLIRIDQRSYLLDRQAAEVNVRQAETDIDSLNKDIENLKADIKLSSANVLLAEKERDRLAALSENQFASKTTLDRAEQQYLQARISLQNIENRLVMTKPLMEQKTAALSMAKVNLQKAGLAYEKASISAPFNGWVLSKLLEVGEYVNPGQPIGTIYEKDRLDVDVSIPMEMMKWVNPLLESGRTPRANITLPVNGEMDPHSWQATLTRFKAGIDEKTRTLPMTLEIEMSNPGHENSFALKPGAFVNCSIQGAAHDNLFVLPRHLLRTGDLIFVSSQGRLKIKKVEVLRKFEEEIFINSGLEQGDLVITSPLPGAVEGMALTIKENGK